MPPPLFFLERRFCFPETTLKRNESSSGALQFMLTSPFQNLQPMSLDHDESAERPLPEFSPWLFWDSDLEKIDYERDASYVIRRVFDIGKLEDVVEVLRYYRTGLIKKILTDATYLPQNAIRLSTALFHLQTKDFKCYSSKRSHPDF